MFHVWFIDFHGKLCDPPRTGNPHKGHACTRSFGLYHILRWFYVDDTLFYIFGSRGIGLCLSIVCICDATFGSSLVSHNFLTRWSSRDESSYVCNCFVTETPNCWLYEMLGKIDHESFRYSITVFLFYSFHTADDIYAENISFFTSNELTLYKHQIMRMVLQLINVNLIHAPSV
mmetsp:Transcript_13342/g.19079  ORF Transcript_13342/g.19079 Transcript_13342/m.19079 type:complete len:174 (-) Transcript_13342:281-802(-)